MIETRHPPLTAAELLQALKRPGSYWQTLFNAELFLLALETESIEERELQWRQDKEREEKEQLNAILEAALRKTEEREEDIKSPPLYAPDTLQQLAQDDPSGFRAALEEALESCFDTLLQVNRARETALFQYEQIHQAVVEEMLMRARSNPLMRPDGTLVDIAEVLSQMPSLQAIARQMIHTVLPLNEYPEAPEDPAAGLYPLLSPLSLVPRPTSRREEEEEQDRLSAFVKKLNLLTELQILHAVNGGQPLDPSQILPSQREAVSHILSPLIANERYAACRKEMFALESSHCLLETRIQRLEEKIDALRANQMRLR